MGVDFWGVGSYTVYITFGEVEMKIPETEHETLRRLFVDGLMSCSKIAERYGCSRQYVYNILQGLGVDTTRKMQTAPCCVCGKVVQRTRGQMRKRFDTYCSSECWATVVGSPEYQDLRQADRMAREAVRKMYSLEPGNVVLHLDGDHWNLELQNLYVVRTLEDLLMYERCGISISGFSILERRWVMLEGRTGG